MIRFLYIVILISVVIGLIFFLTSWYQRDNDGPEISFSGPEIVAIGTPFEIKVDISNPSDQIFQDAKISLSLPQGVVFIGQSPEQNISSKKIGNIGVGGLTSETFQLLVVYDSNQTDASSNEIAKTISAAVDYAPEFLGTRFTAESEWRFNVLESAVALETTSPDQVTGGQEFKLKINYQNQSAVDLDNLVLDIEYPPIFQFIKASIDPTDGQNHWQLGGLHPNSSNELIISGRLLGPESDPFNFIVRLYGSFNGQTYLINEQQPRINIQAAPLALSIVVNDLSDYIAGLGETLLYTINYNYTNKTTPSSALITVKLNSELFDLKTVNASMSDGIFDERNRLISWQLDDLSSSSGKVSFEVKTKDQYPINSLGDRNFTLDIESRMDDGRFAVAAQSTIKIVGQINISAQGLFRDAAAGVVNEGPFPPVIGQPTQYSVHWQITNFSNDIKNAQVKAVLPANVTFVKSSKTSNGQISFNESSGEIVWDISRITAAKGIVGSPLEAIFQISATPPPTALGQYLPLLEITTISAVDEFTDLILNNSDDPITTELPDDATARGQGLVIKTIDKI